VNRVVLNDDVRELDEAHLRSEVIDLKFTGVRFFELLKDLVQFHVRLFKRGHDVRFLEAAAVQLRLNSSMWPVFAARARPKTKFLNRI